MIRIVHLSDLHFVKEGAQVLPSELFTLLQKVTQYVLKESGIELNVGTHDPARLVALETVLHELSPQVIVMTGDLSTYGDGESLKCAADRLVSWKKAYGTVLCVPGNHDVLRERLAGLKQHESFKDRFSFKSAIAYALERFVKSFENLTKGVNSQTPFFEAYSKQVGDRLGHADPALPIWIETTWGWMCFFLFNSVNDPGLMANEGRIGSFQYDRLNAACLQPDYLKRKEQTLQFALLHHHPLPIPYDAGGAYERFYDDMQDGSTLCYHLNTKGFHFVLHGHKHLPYHCTVQYSGSSNLQVLSAGTVTQSGAIPENASFNVIDVLSPFQATIRRFEYRTTGFSENEGLKRTVEPKPISSFRYTSGPIELSADQDLRNLLTLHSEGAENNHEFSLLSWEATIEDGNIYHGVYRLKGKRKRADARSILQVLTGSPKRTWADLKLKAHDSMGKNIQCPQVLPDYPLQKCFELIHPVGVKEEFDYTYEFDWQNEPADDTYFDGFNLCYYSNEVAEVKYAITLPWEPAGPVVEELGFASRRVTLTEENYEAKGQGRFRYSFRLEKPRLLPHLIRMPKLAGG